MERQGKVRIQENVRWQRLAPISPTLPLDGILVYPKLPHELSATIINGISLYYRCGLWFVFTFLSRRNYATGSKFSGFLFPGQTFSLVAFTKVFFTVVVWVVTQRDETLPVLNFLITKV